MSVGQELSCGLLLLTDRATGMHERLRERGFDPVGVDLSELLKAGGGAKCCTLEVRR